MAAMEGVEFWLRWFLLVSPQSWPRHHPPRRGDLERAKRRRQPGWWILESRGEIRRHLALRSQIVLCPSSCDRHACCLWWISLSRNLSFLEKFTLLTNRPLWNQRKRPSGFTGTAGSNRIVLPPPPPDTPDSRFIPLCCPLFLPSEHRSRVQPSAQLDFTENKALKGDWKWQNLRRSQNSAS